MGIDKHHRFQGFATLQLPKPSFKCLSQVLGLHRIECFAHRRITRYPANAVNTLQIVFGPLLIKGEQRGRFEGEHGKGGHQDIAQRDFGIAFSVLRDGTKDIVHRTQQGIGT